MYYRDPTLLVHIDHFDLHHTSPHCPLNTAKITEVQKCAQACRSAIPKNEGLYKLGLFAEKCAAQGTAVQYPEVTCHTWPQHVLYAAKIEVQQM